MYAIRSYYEVGAKVWLVPSSSVNKDTVDQYHMNDNWGEYVENILFENGYVFYKNTNTELLPEGCTTFQCSKCDDGEEEEGLEIIPLSE